MNYTYNIFNTNIYGEPIYLGTQNMIYVVLNENIIVIL